MKHSIITLAAIATLTTSLFASNNAEKIFDNKCAVCHIKTMPTDRASMTAPALMGVMRHVKMAYPNKDEAVAFMVDYVQNPTKAKAICMPQKIARFGVMPSQKGVISPKDLKEVSEWMFDNYPPKNFVGRGMQQGNRGMRNRPTFDMFDANGDGIITKEEFDAFRASRMQQRMNKQGQCAMGSSKGMMRNRSTFEDFDLNNDGYIAKDELLKVRAQKQEKRAAQGMPMRNASKAPSFESIDTNADGKISKGEFNAFVKTRMNKRRGM